jgi:hypothetical protein
MSEEIQADVADAYMLTRKNIEATINENLSKCSLSENFVEWAFIAIVRREDHPDYQEIKKKHVKRKVLEFRLKIDYADFLRSSEPRRIELIINALKRCIALMEELGVSTEDRAKLSKVLDDSYRQLKAS